MRNKIPYKILRVFTVFALLLSVIQGSVFAEGTLEDIIDYNVVYSEDQTKAIISFDMEGFNKERYEIKSITHNEEELSLEEPTYEVDKNGEVEFKVTYVENNQELKNNGNERNITTNEGDENINDEQEDSSINNTSRIESTIETKEQVIMVRIDGIKQNENLTNEEKLNNLTQNQAYENTYLKSTDEGSIDLIGQFNILGSATNFPNMADITYDAENWIIVSKKNIQIGSADYYLKTNRNRQNGAATSKFIVDMKKSFTLKGSYETKGNTPFSFNVGLHNDKRYMNGKNSYFIQDDVKNRVDFEFDNYIDEALTFDNYFKQPLGLYYPHIMTTSTDGSGNKTVLNYSSGTLNPSNDKRDFSLVYDSETDELITNFGNIKSTTQNVSKIVGDEAYFYSAGSVCEGFSTASPWTLNMESVIQIDSFNYTDTEVKENVYYLKDIAGSKVIYDKDNVSTYPQAGEKVIVRHEIYNDNDLGKELSTTANISDFTLDGTTISPDNVKMYTGTPDAPIEVPLDQSDIFNGSVFSDGTFKQATIPLLTKKGKTYLEYEYTIPANQKYSKIDNTIIFGQKGMTQYPFSSSVTIANTPDLKGIDKTIVSKLGTGNMSDTLIRKDIEGKLFDETTFSSLVSDSGDMKLTYTVDGSDTKKIDMSKEGRYKVVYTLEDVRTGMKSEASRSIWVTDKDVDVSGDENIAAQDFVLLTKEVSASTFMDTLKARSGIEAYDKDGKAIAFKDITVTQTIKPTFGMYPVTFTSKAGTSITVECRVYDNGNVDDTNKEAIYANDFSLSEAEAATAEDSVLLNLSKAVAFSTVDMSDVSVKVQSNTIKGKSQGLYDVTFVSDKGTSVTVKGRITKYSDEQNGERITANDFTIDAMGAKHKDPKQLIALAKAEAVKTDTQEKVDIIVDASALKGVKGIYNVVFKTAGGASVTTIATVLEKGGENPDPTIRESIYANNFNLTSKQVIELSKDSEANKLSALIGYAQAKAVDIDSGDSIAITSVESDFKTKKITDADGIEHTVAIEGLYDATYKTNKGTSVTVKVSVPSSIENDTLLLYANGFTISKDEAGRPLSEAEYIKLANAAAIVKADGTMVDVKVLDSSAIQAKAGTYKIKFGTDYPSDTSKNLELEVSVKVVENGIDNPTNDESIRANNIYLKLADIEGLTSNKLIGLANAQAYKTSTGEVVSLEAIHDIKKKAGVYEVNFETALGTSLKVKAYVYDQGKVDGNEAIYGNDFTMSLNEVDSLTNDFLKDRSQVKAFNIITFEDINVTTVSHNIVKKIGSYEATFETTAGTQVKVNVNVVENGITVGDETINANDIYVSSQDVEGLTQDKVISLSKAHAYNNVTNQRLALEAKFSNVVATKGTYDVTMNIVGSATSLTIKAHVYDQGIIDKDNKIAMYANDFTLSVSEARSINDAMIKSLSNMKAFNTDNGEEIKASDISVTHAIIDEVGEYDVTFSKDGVTLHVKAYVQDNVVEANGERISANDFAIQMSDVDTLTVEKVKELAHVNAYLTVDGTRIDTTADISKIEKKKGVYEVSFTTNTMHATSIKVKAEVFEQGSVNTENKEVIYANHFSLSKKDALNVSDAKLIQLANAKAYHTETGASVNIDKVTHAITNMKNVYPVTFETVKKTSCEVQASVVENEVIDPINNEKIIANDFMISKDQVATLDDTKIIALANAKAYDLATGNEVSIPVVEQDIQDIKGVYKVKLKTTKGTNIEIEAHVYDYGVVNPDNKEAIFANDILLSKEEAKNISDDLLKERSAVSAMNTDTGVSVKISKVTHNIEAKVNVYDVTFSTLKKSSVTVKARVFEEGSVDPITKEIIQANSIALSKQDVATLNDEILKQKASASAYHMETLKKVNITSVVHNISEVVGTYDVTFATANNTSVSVKATVFDMGVIDPTTKEAIYANHFQLNETDLDSLSNSVLIDKAKAKAFNIETGSSVSIDNVIHNIVRVQSMYPVTFETMKKTSIQTLADVKVIPKVDNEVTDKNNGSQNSNTLESLKRLIVEQRDATDKEKESKIKTIITNKVNKNAKKNRLDNEQNQSNNDNNPLWNGCYWHWGMIGIMIAYAGYMLLLQRKDEE